MVWVGAESGSQKILDAMEKGTRVEQIYEAARACARRRASRWASSSSSATPARPARTSNRPSRWCATAGPDDIGISVSYPLPGTKFYAAVREQLGEKQNWQDSSDLAMLYQGPFGTAFYRQLHTVLHNEFRARKYRPSSAGCCAIRGERGARTCATRSRWSITP